MNATAAVISDDIEAEASRTLGTIARSLLEDADGDTEAAIDALEARIASDETLRRQLADRAIRMLLRARVLSNIANIRARIVATGSGRADPRRDVAGPDRARALANAMRSTFLDFPLRGGLRLGQATRADVTAQAARYAKMGTTCAHNARWLVAIADRLPDDARRVADALTEVEIAALRSATEVPA